eukprot:6210284-Prymnesium_polylepis.1
MHGDQDKTTPGNALTSQPDTPFHSLRRFGNALLDKVRRTVCARWPAALRTILGWCHSGPLTSAEAQPRELRAARIGARLS